MAAKKTALNVSEVLEELSALTERLSTSAVSKAERQQLQKNALALLQEIDKHKTIDLTFLPVRSFGIVGQSKVIKEMLQFIRKVGPSEATVLLIGENGTGKEGAARAVHFSSKRSQNMFCKQNCGALAEGLLDSELFGHVQGAFTGAHTSRSGLFDQADGGTLFLDEIGDTSPAMQVKLLRVLQEGTFVPVGGSKEKKVDVRVIAATNKNLKKMVYEGVFREDLFYRLNVLQICTPALRDRAGDIPLLAEHFLDKFSTQYKTPRKYVTQKILSRLVAHPWPGNVRELEHQITRLCVLAEDSVTLSEHHLSPEFLLDNPIRSNTKQFHFEKGLGRLTDEFQREVIEAALAYYNFHYTKTAAVLQVTTRGLSKMFTRLGINTDLEIGANEALTNIDKNAS